MQIPGIQLETAVDWILHGGNTAVLMGAAVVLWRVSQERKQEQTIKQNYPPHRHINGRVLYPKEYPPPETETPVYIHTVAGTGCSPNPANANVTVQYIAQ